MQYRFNGFRVAGLRPRGAPPVATTRDPFGAEQPSLSGAMELLGAAILESIQKTVSQV